MSDRADAFVHSGTGARFLASAPLCVTPARARTGAASLLRWTRPDSWHLTVLFLGSQPATALPVIREALAGMAADTRRFMLSALEIGAPGQLDQPRLVWLRCDDRWRARRSAATPGNAATRSAISNTALQGARDARSSNENRSASNSERRWQRWNESLRPGRHAGIAKLILFRSYLERAGARYEPLVECELG